MNIVFKRKNQDFSGLYQFKVKVVISIQKKLCLVHYIGGSDSSLLGKPVSSIPYIKMHAAIMAMVFVAWFWRQITKSQ